MSEETKRLLRIMERLRNPSKGCPWDLEQDFKSISPYTIEEAYEVADAISRDDMTGLKEELGDLLFQVVFHAQIASEAGVFNYADVVEAVSDKMVRRHPHVFSDVAIISADVQEKEWDDIKAMERLAKGEDASTLGDIPRALPALTRANKLQKRAARVGFDWDQPEQVLDKIREEIEEIEAETENASNENLDGMTEEIGDLLFTCANLARKWGVDSETALRAGNEKFERRFRAMETHFQERRQNIADMGLEELELAWRLVKEAERG